MSATQLPTVTNIIDNVIFLFYMIGLIILSSLRLTLIVEMGPPDRALFLTKIVAFERSGSHSTKRCAFLLADKVKH